MLLLLYALYEGCSCPRHWVMRSPPSSAPPPPPPALPPTSTARDVSSGRKAEPRCQPSVPGVAQTPTQGRVGPETSASVPLQIGKWALIREMGLSEDSG